MCMSKDELELGVYIACISVYLPVHGFLFCRWQSIDTKHNVVTTNRNPIFIAAIIFYTRYYFLIGQQDKINNIYHSILFLGPTSHDLNVLIKLRFS